MRGRIGIGGITGDCPCGTRRIGDSTISLITDALQTAEHAGEQSMFTPEQMGAAGDIQEKTAGAGRSRRRA